MIVPFTASGIREAIASKIPIEHRALVTAIAWSAHDGGVSSGLANQPRSANPFESMLPTALPAGKPKGKAR